MPSYGPASLRVLYRADPGLVRVFTRLIKVVDHRLICSVRGKLAQNAAFDSGASKVRWPDSSHNVPIVDLSKPRWLWDEDSKGLSSAIDFEPYPVDPSDARQFAYIAGRLIEIGEQEGVPLRWGGDWDRDGNGVWRSFAGNPERGGLIDLYHVERWHPGE